MLGKGKKGGIQLLKMEIYQFIQKYFVFDLNESCTAFVERVT